MSFYGGLLKNVYQYIEKPTRNLIKKLNTVTSNISKLPPDKQPSPEELERLAKLIAAAAALLLTIKEWKEKKEQYHKMYDQGKRAIEVTKQVINAQKLAGTLNPVAAGIEIAQTLAKEKMEEKQQGMDLGISQLEDSTDSAEEDLADAVEEAQTALDETNASSAASDDRQAENDVEAPKDVNDMTAAEIRDLPDEGNPFR
tara:strand:+ start:1389 stop:1988 length:600 start_codon:yes stop_codon:yes gene_type:complete